MPALGTLSAESEIMNIFAELLPVEHRGHQGRQPDERLAICRLHPFVGIHPCGKKSPTRTGCSKSLRFLAVIGLAVLAAVPEAIALPFPCAVAANHAIDMNGHDILSDSFDSRDLWHSWFGQYQASTAKDNGNLATNDSLTNSLSGGNANIYGHVSTGPAGSVAVGNKGGVGEHSWQASNPGQIEPGWFVDNSNFTLPEVSLPYATGLPPGGPQTIVTTTYNITSTSNTTNVYPNQPPWSGVVTNWVNTNTASYTYAIYTTNAIHTTNLYDHVINSGDYYTTANLSGSTIVMGDARLVLPNGLSMSGNDQITIATGGSLMMFCGGTHCTIGGNGVINQSGYAENFILECTPSVTTLTFNGNGEFIGVLLAPEADMTMNGGGKASNDFIGSLMMNSVRINGYFWFHYDESLSSSGIIGYRAPLIFTQPESQTVAVGQAATFSVLAIGSPLFPV